MSTAPGGAAVHTMPSVEPSTRATRPTAVGEGNAQTARRKPPPGSRAAPPPPTCRLRPRRRSAPRHPRPRQRDRPVTGVRHAVFGIAARPHRASLGFRHVVWVFSERVTTGRQDRARPARSARAGRRWWRTQTRSPATGEHDPRGADPPARGLESDDPVLAADTRRDPAVSVPSAKGTTPAAIATALPELDPPEIGSPPKRSPARRTGFGCRSARWRTHRGWACLRRSRPRRGAGARWWRRRWGVAERGACPGSSGAERSSIAATRAYRFDASKREIQARRESLRVGRAQGRDPRDVRREICTPSIVNSLVTAKAFRG